MLCLQDAHAEDISALKTLIAAAQEKVLEEEKSHAATKEQIKASADAAQADINELQAKIEALEATLGKLINNSAGNFYPPSQWMNNDEPG